ncbi:hypothetical protein FOL46_000954 [Perkinsus olseni]|uniref:Transmembrane protein n=1 Tax=Perkinsus olseni TaxID=32597 RepID=A0A7J6KV33_PEROL|nr:hypothetical protein FOL46_000954 [Perkinsus olseni]
MMILILTFPVSVVAYGEGVVHAEGPPPIFHPAVNTKFFPNDPHIVDKPKDGHGVVWSETSGREDAAKVEARSSRNDDDRDRRESSALELLEKLRDHHEEIITRGNYQFAHDDADSMALVIDRILGLLEEGREGGVHNSELLSALWALHDLHPQLFEAAVDDRHRDYLHALAQSGSFIGDYHLEGAPHQQGEDSAHDRAEETSTQGVVVVEEAGEQSQETETVSEVDQQSTHDAPIGEVSTEGEHLSEVGNLLSHDPDHSNAEYGAAHAIEVIYPTQQQQPPRRRLVEDSLRGRPSSEAAVLLVVLGVIGGTLVCYYLHHRKQGYQRSWSLPPPLEREMSRDVLDDFLAAFTVASRLARQRQYYIGRAEIFERRATRVIKELRMMDRCSGVAVSRSRTADETREKGERGRASGARLPKVVRNEEGPSRRPGTLARKDSTVSMSHILSSPLAELFGVTASHVIDSPRRTNGKQLRPLSQKGGGRLRGATRRVRGKGVPRVTPGMSLDEFMHAMPEPLVEEIMSEYSDRTHYDREKGNGPNNTTPTTDDDFACSRELTREDSALCQFSVSNCPPSTHCAIL